LLRPGKPTHSYKLGAAKAAAPQRKVKTGDICRACHGSGDGR
jgi:hypothetical protein